MPTTTGDELKERHDTHHAAWWSGAERALCRSSGALRTRSPAPFSKAITKFLSRKMLLHAETRVAIHAPIARDNSQQLARVCATSRSGARCWRSSRGTVGGLEPGAVDQLNI
jgi:hypothetical protein